MLTDLGSKGGSQWPGRNYHPMRPTCGSGISTGSIPVSGRRYGSFITLWVKLRKWRHKSNSGADISSTPESVIKAGVQITPYSFRSFSTSVPLMKSSILPTAIFSLSPSFISVRGLPSRILIVAFRRSRTS